MLAERLYLLQFFELDNECTHDLASSEAVAAMIAKRRNALAQLLQCPLPRTHTICDVEQLL
jgi:hypothetical protein